METAAMTSRPSSTLSLPGSKPEETKVAATASSSKQETKTKAATKPAAKKDAKSAKTPEKAASKETGKKSPTITLVTKKCPSKAGTGRAKRWAKLKTGMTVVAAQELSIPLSYLRRMEAAGHLKIG